ncbi:hypothetical protein B0H14DRAFT_2916948 [Mycena olivaceomarginata]|nr:hypothetical protein B0H14DRAFT_2916948 [Mycena olivaceomarginata]
MFQRLEVDAAAMRHFKCSSARPRRRRRCCRTATCSRGSSRASRASAARCGGRLKMRRRRGRGTSRILCLVFMLDDGTVRGSCLIPLAPTLIPSRRRGRDPSLDVLLGVDGGAPAQKIIHSECIPPRWTRPQSPCNAERASRRRCFASLAVFSFEVLLGLVLFFYPSVTLCTSCHSCPGFKGQNMSQCVHRCEDMTPRAMSGYIATPSRTSDEARGCSVSAGGSVCTGRIDARVASVGRDMGRLPLSIRTRAPEAGTACAPFRPARSGRFLLMVLAGARRGRRLRELLFAGVRVAQDGDGKRGHR